MTGTFLQLALAAFALVPRVSVPTTQLAAGPAKPVAVAPDGSWVAFVSTGGIIDPQDAEGAGRVQVWDLRTGTLDRSFAAPGIWRAEPVAVSPDGRWLAYPGYENYKRQIRLHDFRTGARVHTLNDVGEENCPLGFSPDGKELVSFAPSGSRIVVWSVPDGAKLREVKTPLYERVTLSPDAKSALVQPYYGALPPELWDLSTGKKVGDLGRNSSSGKATFVRGGKELALLWRGYKTAEFRVWDLATMKSRVVSKFPDTTPHPAWHAIADDLSAVGVVECYGGLKVYEAGKSEPRFHFAPKPASYEGVLFTPDAKRVIVVQPYHRAWVLDAATGKPVFSLDTDYRSVKALAFSADGKTLLAGLAEWPTATSGGSVHPPDGYLAAWDAATGELKHVARGTDNFLHSLHPSPDGRKVIAVTGNYPDQAEWWDVAAGKRLKVLAAAADRVQYFGGSADGRKFGGVKYEPAPRPDDKPEAVLSATRLWDPATGERLPDLPAIASSYPLRFTPDGERVLYHNHRGSVQAMRTSGGKSNAIWKSTGNAGDPYPHDPIPLPGGESFVSFHQPQFNSAPFHLYLFDVGRAVKFGEADIPVSPIAISPDGKWVAAGGQATLWHGKTSNPVYLWRVPELPPLDEKQLAAGKRTTSESPAKRVELTGHAGEVFALAFSPDGKTLASGGRDRVIRLWDVETGELRATLWAAPAAEPGAAPTDWAAFTPEGFHAGTTRGRAFLRFPKVADPALLFQPEKVKEALRGK